MGDLRYRTEDFKLAQLEDFFVSSSGDEEILKRLCGRETILLVGSRGVGKSFLLRLSERRLETNFLAGRVLPVYVTFSRSTLLQAGNQLDFRSWMLAKICSRVVRSLAACGVSAPAASLSILAGGVSGGPEDSPLEDLVTRFEAAWSGPNDSVTTESVPEIEDVKDVLAEICESAGIDRINLFIDEAAHVLVPDHQRQFFTLMRDLRCPYLSIKAAVYPGTTSYGDSFEPSHDAVIVTLDRDPRQPEYLEQMREMVIRQDGEYEAPIDRNKSNFNAIALAASGNPRTLLKTFSRAPKMSGRDVREVLREFYREEIWSDHSNLGIRYAGHRGLIDWGRDFLESWVVPRLSKRNQSAVEKSAFIWIHRDVPAAVKEALRLLSYSGLVHEVGTSIRATRRELGTRYMVNLGCLLSVESDPVATAATLCEGLAIKRMMEFGKDHRVFTTIAQLEVDPDANPSAEALRDRLDADIEKLDLSTFQRDSLRSVELDTIGSVLNASEYDIQQAHYVGPTRSRQMTNAAQAAVLEYLSG